MVCRSSRRLLQRAPGWIGRRVPVQWDGLNVRLLHPGQLLREHLRQKRGWQGLVLAAGPPTPSPECP